MCVRARVVTPLHEDDMWMIQANAFLSPVPLVAGPSAQPRRHDSARHHLLSKMPCRKNNTRKATFHGVTVDASVVVVDDQPVLTDHIQTDENKCRIV